MTKKQKQRLDEIEEEIAPLQEFIDDAKEHRAAIKKLVSELEKNPKRCIIYLDFTKFTIVEDGSVNCFVVSVVSGPGYIDDKGMMFCVCCLLFIIKELGKRPLNTTTSMRNVRKQRKRVKKFIVLSKFFLMSRYQFNYFSLSSYYISFIATI